MVKQVTLVTMATLALAASVSLAMSIENEPVKVTHRNSGPRYDFSAPESNEVERTKIENGNGPSMHSDSLPRFFIGGPQPQAPPAEQGGEQSGEPAPIGHVAIRRIYLFPVMSRGPPSENAEGEREREQQQAPGPQEAGESQMPGMFAKPFWPFLTPARPSPASFHAQHEHPMQPMHSHPRPHLFGADEASRSPSQGSANQDDNQDRRPLFDPIQMMLDMMHQAISAQMAPPQSDLSNTKDSSNKNDNAPAESAASDEQPKMPGQTDLMMPRPAGGAKNETREDIIEIEGKKYLRKTIINRHIGENIIFMTKRLIFVPLNETDDSPATTTTESVITTSLPPTSGSPTTTTTPEDSSVIPDRVGENKPTTTTMASSSNSPTTTTTELPPAVSTEEVITMSSKGPGPLSTIQSLGEPVTETTPASMAAAANTEPATESTMASTTPKPTETFVDRVSDVIEKAAERLVEETKEVVGSTSSTTTTSTQAPAVSEASDKQQ